MGAAAGGGAAVIEQKLTGIWSAIFGLPCGQVDTDASLFEIGGTSVQAVQLATRITETFGVSLDLADIFADGIAGLTALIWQAVQAGPAEPDDEEYGRLLAELEDVSEEEAVRLLQDLQAAASDDYR